jgi:hypothetical protein
MRETLPGLRRDDQQFYGGRSFRDGQDRANAIESLWVEERQDSVLQWLPKA